MVDDLVARARAFSIVYHGAPKPLIDELADRIEKLEAALGEIIARDRTGFGRVALANVARAALSDSSAVTK